MTSLRKTLPQRGRSLRNLQRLWAQCAQTTARPWVLRWARLPAYHIAEPYPITKRAWRSVLDGQPAPLASQSEATSIMRTVRARSCRTRLLRRPGLLPGRHPDSHPAACEGTTTLFELDYFNQSAFLSQSGQLYNEANASAFTNLLLRPDFSRGEKQDASPSHGPDGGT